MACCLQLPDPNALSFQAERRSSGPRPSPPGAAPEPLDALSLLSLHCASLGAKPADRVQGGSDPGSAARRERGPGSPAQGRLPASFPAAEARRVPRKQLRPQRSWEARDPAFQGVTFRMQLSLCQTSSGDCQLLIRSRFSSGKLGKRSRIPLAKEECRVASSKEEERCPPTHRDKCCASCKTKKTPLWRDAEDGTPLCNACGIRYKKYRIRCFQCWNIPKHGGNPFSHCSSCGLRLHLVAAQEKSRKRCGGFLRLCS